MEFETHRLSVREFSPADVVRIHDIATADGFVFYNLDGTEDSSQAFVDRAIDLQTADVRDSFKMAVEDKARPGHCIGYVSIDDIGGDEPGQPDVGYLIDPREQGQGFATEAMIGLMQNVFHTHPAIGVVWLTVHPENIASQKVAGRLTFEQVGTKEITTAHGQEPRLVYKTDRDRFTAEHGALECLIEQ